MFEASYEVAQVDDRSVREQVDNSSLPVLVAVSATWCDPCRAMDPILDRLAREFGRRLKVVRIDADQGRGFLDRYSVEGVPTWLLLKEGEETDRIAGIHPYAMLKERLDRVL